MDLLTSKPKTLVNLLKKAEMSFKVRFKVIKQMIYKIKVVVLNRKDLLILELVEEKD
jgi:hypothetical protein